MTRKVIAAAGAALVVLAGAVAYATAAGDAPTTIEACRNIRHGLVRIVVDGKGCKSNEAALSWDLQGREGPAGPAGPAGAPGPAGPKGDPGGGIASVDSLAGTACKTFDGKAGKIDVGSTATDLITLTCESGTTPPPTGSARLVINEVDYDQVGADTGGFVEIANTGTSAATLDGIALVLVNGGDGAEYGRKTLTGSLAAGAKLVVDVDLQNGAPDGVALVDTGKRRASRRTELRGCDHDRHDRNEGLRPRRGHDAPGRRCRLEHGRWVAVADPGRLRYGQRGGRLVVHDDPDARGSERQDAVSSRARGGATARLHPRRPLAIRPSAACSLALPWSGRSISCGRRTRRACRASARGARAPPAA